MNDKVKFVKKNGEIIEDISASVQKNKVFLDKCIKVEEGDTIEWTNLLGVKERLLVEYVHIVKDRSGDFHHIEINYHKGLK